MENIFTLNGTIPRGRYFWAGVISLAIKFQIDRIVIANFFHKAWLPWNYLYWPDWISDPAKLSTEQRQACLVLVAIALPFIWAGVALTVRRLRDVNLPPYLVCIFFVPFINIFLFALLCMLPSKAADEIEGGLPNSSFARMLPHTTYGSAGFGLVVTAALGLGLTMFSVEVLEHYGWGVFIGTPFMMGLMSAIIFSAREERSKRECLAVANASVTLLGGLFLLFMIEGVICVLMAAPIAFILSSLGGYVGFLLQRSCRFRHQASALVVTLPLLPFLMSIEAGERLEAPALRVQTSLVIEAAPEVVWRNVVAFPELKPPTELLFKVGIAYPIRARIEGSGVGAIRRCEFSTGPFVEPITIWDPPRVLGFSVTSVPHPMQEWTLWGALETKHLSGFFRSTQGEFRLTEIAPGRTLIEGTTWYEHKIWPVAYWKLFSDAVIHRIHLRVLEHIRELSEVPSPP